MDGKRVIGVDIGKRWLDVAREGGARVERHANDATGIALLWKVSIRPRDIVVFERSGGYERELETALAGARVPWAVVHSARVKAFRQVQGIKAKTDAIDARLLQGVRARSCECRQVAAGPAEDVVLDALMARRSPAQGALHAEQCRLRHRRDRAGTRLDRTHDRSARGRAHRHRGRALRPRSQRSAARLQGSGAVRAQGRGAGDRAGAACRVARARKARPPGNRRARWLGTARAPERAHAAAAWPCPRPCRREGDPVQSSPHRDAMGSEIMAFCNRLRARASQARSSW